MAGHSGSGTKADPWVLKTPPGTSEYQMYRDDAARSAGDRLPGRRDAAEVRRVARSTTSTRCSRRTATGCRSAAPTSRSRRPRDGRGVGSLGRQPGRWLVRPEEGSPRPVRHVHAAAPRGARAGRGHPRRQEQPDAGASSVADARGARRPAIPFEALGDPNRRAIVELLGAGGRSVQELADALPISRPAVSRHLRLLKEAGLVGRGAARHAAHLPAPRRGRRGRPRLSRAVWGDAAARFRAGRREHERRATAAVIEPIRLDFEVECPADHAFEVWTARIAQWWPADHTVSGEADSTVVLEGRPGGRIFERTPAGVEHDWGEVTVWEPPSRLVYRWHLRRDRADATEVEIRFVDRGAATHAGRDRASRLGARSAPRARRGATGTTAAGRRCCRTTSRPPVGRAEHRPPIGPAVGAGCHFRTAPSGATMSTCIPDLRRPLLRPPDPAIHPMHEAPPTGDSTADPLAASLSRRRFLRTAATVTGGGLVAAGVAACAPALGPTWTFGPGVVPPVASPDATGADGSAAPSATAGASASMDHGSPAPSGSHAPDHDATALAGVKRFLDGEWQTVDGYGNQPLEPTLDGDTKVFQMTVDADRAPDRCGQAARARARLQRHVAGSPAARHRGRPDPRRLQEQPRQIDRDPFPWATPPEQYGWRPAHHPGPDPPGALVHLRVHRAATGSHMYHSHHNATDQVGRGLLGAFLVDPKDPAQRYDGAVRRDPGHRLDQQRRARWLHDQRPRFPGHCSDHRDPRRDDRHPLHERGHDDASMAPARDADARRRPRRLPARVSVLQCDTLGRQPGRAVGRRHRLQHPGAWAFHCHILPHAEGHRGMFGMVTALVVQEPASAGISRSGTVVATAARAAGSTAYSCQIAPLG